MQQVRHTLFVPEQLKTIVDDCNLLGTSVLSSNIRYTVITATIPLDCHLIERNVVGEDIETIGIVQKSSNHVKVSHRSKKGIMLALKDGRLYIKKASCEGQNSEPTVVYFNPNDLLTSKMLQSVNNHEASFSFVDIILRSFESTLLLADNDKRISTLCKKNLDQRLKNETTTDIETFNWKNVATSFSQLSFRLKQFSVIKKGKISRNSLEWENNLSAVVFDIALGICVTAILLHCTKPLFWLDRSLIFANGVVENLKQLIVTLMEMPAGLKLNRPLNNALGEFFQYHIYLCKNYITIIKPVFEAVVELIVVSGLCGFTCLLSILCDSFSLATIHIYCFYGYAARLYNFQFHGLCSLWRLFRGKKYNQLKDRVDSYSYSNEQLFLGSISFTILLFLLPTVLLYYLVFLVLRLVTLSILLSIKFMVAIISNLPVYSILLWIVGSKKLINSVYFDIQAHGTTNGLPKEEIYLKTKVMDFFELFSSDLSQFQTSDAMPLSDFIKNISVGNIIYPM